MSRPHIIFALTRYKIFFKPFNISDEVDYVFTAHSDDEAKAMIKPFTELYTITRVWKYNRELKQYIAVKSLEDFYVKNR